MVATDEAARKLIVPPSVAAVAERNVGTGDRASAADGASQAVASSATEKRAPDLRLDDRRANPCPVPRPLSGDVFARQSPQRPADHTARRAPLNRERISCEQVVGLLCVCRRFRQSPCGRAHDHQPRQPPRVLAHGGRRSPLRRCRPVLRRRDAPGWIGSAPSRRDAVRRAGRHVDGRRPIRRPWRSRRGGSRLSRTHGVSRDFDSMRSP